MTALFIVTAIFGVVEVVSILVIHTRCTALTVRNRRFAC